MDSMDRKGLLVVGVFAAALVLVFFFSMRSAGPGGGAGWANELIPSDADVVGRFEVEPLRRLMLEPWVGAGLTRSTQGGMWGDADLESELKGLLLDRIGVHVHDISSAAFFVKAKEKQAAFMMRGQFEGTPKGNKSRDYKGITVLPLNRDVDMALIDGDLVLGTSQGVEAVIDLSKGEGKSLASGGDKAQVHADMAKAVGGSSALIVTGQLSELPPEAYSFFTGGKKVEGLAISLDADGIWHAAALGEPDALDAIKTQIVTMISAGLGFVDSEKEMQKKEGDTLEAASAIIGARAMHKLSESLELERDGRVLEARFNLEGAPAALPMVGIMAAVAIPAFMKYQRRAKRARYEMEDMKRMQELRLEELEEEPIEDYEGDDY